MQRFTEIRAWQHAHRFVVQLYRETRSFPNDERFGLQAQLHRAAVSVSANIAEGSKRDSDADFARFLNIAEGSVAELEALVMIASDLGYFAPEVANSLMNQFTQLGKMLHGLRTVCANSASRQRREASP